MKHSEKMGFDRLLFLGSSRNKNYERETKNPAETNA